MIPHFNVRTHTEGERELALRMTTVPNREEETGEQSFTTCTLPQILFRQKNQHDVQRMWHALSRKRHGFSQET